MTKLVHMHRMKIIDSVIKAVIRRVAYEYEPEKECHRVEAFLDLK
ncbi:hypothetical protein lbkm_3951 [Lachnospiraceae bacterium KM106-2]|nr:hypothetical protein lbkm_3951 [Lachnospiraceae bacterium KM106-2]